jgi:hypothetical protein
VPHGEGSSTVFTRISASEVGAAVGCGAARSRRCAARKAGNDPYDLDLALALAEAAQEAASSIAALASSLAIRRLKSA